MQEFFENRLRFDNVTESLKGHCKRSLSLVGAVRMLQFGSLNLLIMDKQNDDDDGGNFLDTV